MTVDQLIADIYEDNWSHIDFIENMNSGECDCLIHNTLNLIAEYADIKEDTNA